MKAHKNIKQLENGEWWFTESCTLWPGQSMSLKLSSQDSILHQEQSLYQDVLVFESSDYGNVLVLDGVI